MNDEFLITCLIVICTVVYTLIPFRVHNVFLLVFITFSSCIFLYGFMMELERATLKAQVEYEVNLHLEPPVDCGPGAIRSNQLPLWQRIGLVLHDTRDQDCQMYIDHITVSPRAQPAQVLVSYVCKLGVIIADHIGIALHRLIAHHNYLIQIVILVLIVYCLYSYLYSYRHHVSRPYDILTDPSLRIDYIKTIEQC